MQTQTLTEFSIYLAQRPGELAGILESAAAGGVEITSISTTEHVDRGYARLLGEPTEALRRVCESLVESGVGPVVESTVVAIPMAGKPGLVRDIAVLMADNRINVRYCYLAPSPVDGTTRAIFRFDELDRALEVIAKADWPVEQAGPETAA